MNANAPLAADVQKKDDNRRKRKALLAGGVVLGIGAAVTLAAWSDDVFADGIFQTGTFELQGAIDGTTFQDYDGPAGDADGGVGRLTFAQDPLNLTPNVEVFAPISLQLSADTSVDAETVVLESVSIADTDNALNNNLSYAVYEDVAAAECTAGSPGGDSAAGGTISDNEVAHNFGGLDADPLTVHEVCLGVTLNSNDEDVQGADAQVTWQFTANSVE